MRVNEKIKRITPDTLICGIVVNGKIKCRKLVNLNVGFPIFFINDTITIEVIVKMNENDKLNLRNKLKV